MTGQKSALFQFINYNKAEGNTKEYQVERIPFYQAGNENIVNILDISYYRDTFMINEDRCWHNVNISKYSCRRYISASYRDDTEYFEYDDTTPLNESLFYKLKIQDNFGNEYSLLWHPYPISGAPHLTSLNNKK